MNKTLLKNKLNALSIEITDEQLEKFDKFTELMLYWNERISLTSITEEEEIIDKHYVDSLTLLKTELIEGHLKVLDLGTGGGYPGIPLKIMNNALEMTLLDSRLKKIEYLDNIVETLGFNDLELIHSRAENLGQDPAYRETYDLVVSRAVANLSSLAEYCLPFLKIGGYFIAMKGSDYESEVNEAKKAIKKFGGEIQEIIDVKIPKTDIVHSLVMIKKERSTPNKYPRRPGTPTKDPVQ